MGLFRRFSRGNLWDEVASGLFLGARLSEKEALQIAPRVGCVIDLCAELSEVKLLREKAGYRSLPTLDTRAPENLRSLALGIQAARKTGVYVQCAAGRGRSATAVCAVLLLSGEAKTLEAAQEIVRKKRPMEIHRAQMEALANLEN